MSINIKEYFEELEDIPGTLVFTMERARKGFWINQMAMSLMKAENREKWRDDAAGYLDEWPGLTAEQRQALLERDYNKCLKLGGNIYYLAKIFSTDGLSFVQAVSTMSGMSVEDYKAMMSSGGRSPEGVRSKKAQAARAATKKER